MRVDLDARIQTRDGETMGSVQRAIVDPARNEISELVISTGAILGRDVLLPVDEIDRASADGDTIRLELTKEEVENLPTYMADQYVAPPAGWTPAATPVAYGGGFLWPATYPAGVPAARYPAAGAYPHAGTPEAGLVPGRDYPDNPSIGKGDAVVDRDGENLGVVDDVLLDPETGRLHGFVLRFGNALLTFVGGGNEAEVGIDEIETVGEGEVRLKMRKDDLRSTT